MKKPKLRELKEAVTALIKGPYTDKFPKAPAKVMETYRGKPEYHEDDCVVCGACGEVCPVRAIEMVDERREDGTAVRRMVLHYDICIMCGQCQRACITEKGMIPSLDISPLEAKVVAQPPAGAGEAAAMKKAGIPWWLWLLGGAAVYYIWKKAK